MEDTDGNTALMSALQDLLANGIAALKLTSAALKGIGLSSAHGVHGDAAPVACGVRFLSLTL